MFRWDEGLEEFIHDWKYQKGWQDDYDWICQRVIKPVANMARYTVKRLNRMLPVGHRWRGDVM